MGPMKTLPLLLLAGVLAVPTFAADAPTKTAADQKSALPDQVMSVTEAKLTGPFVLKDGAISQPATTGANDGGRAVFTFKVAVAGNYVVHGGVNAPDEDSNS